MKATAQMGGLTNSIKGHSIMPCSSQGNRMKHVTVSVRMDSDFVKHLNLAMSLKHPKWYEGDYHGSGGKITAIDCVAAIILAEARGALPEQVHMAIPHEWRPNIEAIHDARKVEELETMSEVK